jgi:hypothetical protein
LTESPTANVLAIAVAPVFLISGIGMLLNIMSLRYGRVIDRTRFLLREGDRIYKEEISGDHLRYELRVLYERARYLRFTVIFASAAIFCVSVTIFCAFAEKIFELPMPHVAIGFFLVALICLLISLMLLMRDFHKSMILIKHDLKSRAPESV